MKIVKVTTTELIIPLTYLCKLSIETGKVPDNQLQISRVVPIVKKGDKSKVNNYRPVSAISKIYEKNIYNRIFDKYVSLATNQFGFRKSYSTSHAIYSLVKKFHESVE